MIDSDFFSIENSQAFAQGNFQNVQLIYEFAEKHKNSIMGVLSKPGTNERDECIKGLWVRVYFWLNSLNKLNATRDFQALASANRALLEIMIDLALLHKDKTNESGWKMRYWGLSEKLKGAKQIINFFTERNLDVPDKFSDQIDFINREEQILLLMRSNLWNGSHPKRWTGKGNLFDDLAEVDSSLGDSIIKVLGISLTQYYRTEYRKMNWFIHSGTASFYNLPKEFYPILSGFFLKGCADFAFLSTEIVLEDFGLNAHLPNYHQEIETLKTDRLMILYQNMRNEDSFNS